MAATGPRPHSASQPTARTQPNEEITFPLQVFPPEKVLCFPLRKKWRTISKAEVEMISRAWKIEMSQFRPSHSLFFQDLFSFVPLVAPQAPSSLWFHYILGAPNCFTQRRWKTLLAVSLLTVPVAADFKLCSCTSLIWNQHNKSFTPAFSV